MTDLTSKYCAIRKISGYISTSLGLDDMLKNILLDAASALPQVSLELLIHEDRRFQVVRPDVQDSAEIIAEQTMALILACDEPCSISLTGEDVSKIWVVPLIGLNIAQSALVCRGTIKKTDKDFLQIVANYLSVLLSSKLKPPSSSLSEKRIQEVSAIYEISQAFDDISLDALLRLITQKAAEVMDAQACSLMLKDHADKELVIKASYGLPEEVVEMTRVSYGEGVAGKVAQTGRSMLINDLQDDPRFVDSNITPRSDIASSICVPLKDADSLVHGVISIRRRSPSEVFNEDDVKLFSVFASQAALAISNAQLYNNLRKRVLELSTLYETSQKLSASYDLQAASNTLVKKASKMVEGASAFLVILDERKKGIRAVSGVFEKKQESLTNTIDDSMIAWMSRLHSPKNIPLRSKSKYADEIKTLAQAIDESIKRLYLIPLITEDSVIGVLALGTTNDTSVEQGMIRLLSIIASQAATIIKNVSSYEEQMDQKVMELSTLYELSERISTARSLEEVLGSILDVVRDIVRYDETSISTVDSKKDMVTIRAYRGPGGCQGENFPLDKDCLISWAIRERKALVSPDITNDKRFGQSYICSDNVRALMAIPLIVNGEVIGVLNVCSFAPNLYNEENVRTLSVIASQAAALYKGLEALGNLANYTDNILRSVAAGVVALDKDGRVLAWNQAAEGVVSIPANEAIDKHFAELLEQMNISKTDKKQIFDAIDKVMTTGENYMAYKQEINLPGADSLYVNLNISQLKDHTDQVLGLVIIFEDVTKQVVMEREMHRISELAATGQLAASIAHELRNPLSSIKGAAQYLQREYEDHSSIKEFLGIIIDEVNGLNRIATEFLDFARPTKLRFQSTYVNDVLVRTLKFLQKNLDSHGVKIDKQFKVNIPQINADDKQLQQVFLNIILNALQAMPDGGKLEISTSALKNGAKVKITDNGVGIPEDQMEQIFKPFFTTKTKGTGLGLTIVEKIVKNHGGKIDITSKVGKGTTFEIFLPIGNSDFRPTAMSEDRIAQISEPHLLRRTSAWSRD